jgi:hypothetical protein
MEITRRAAQRLVPHVVAVVVKVRDLLILLHRTPRLLVWVDQTVAHDAIKRDFIRDQAVSNFTH